MYVSQIKPLLNCRIVLSIGLTLSYYFFYEPLIKGLYQLASDKKGILYVHHKEILFYSIVNWFNKSTMYIQYPWSILFFNFIIGTKLTFQIQINECKMSVYDFFLNKKICIWRQRTVIPYHYPVNITMKNEREYGL